MRSASFRMGGASGGMWRVAILRYGLSRFCLLREIQVYSGREEITKMLPFVIIDAPSVLGLRPNGVEELPEALRAAGLQV